MFVRLLKESFARAKGRQALAVVAVALGVAVSTAMLAVFLDVGDRMSRELRSFGANIVVTPAADTLPVEIGGIDYRPVAEGAYIPEALLPKLKTIFWRHNILAFAPFLYVPVALDGGHQTVLVGTWFDHEFTLANGERYRTGLRETNRTWKVEGSWPVDSRLETGGWRLEAEKTTEVQSPSSEASSLHPALRDSSLDVAGALVGRRLAEKLRIRPGHTLRVAAQGTGGAALRITGILSTGGAEEDQIYAPLSLAQQLAGQPGRLRRIQVSALTQPEDAFARRDPRTMTPAERDRWYCTPYVSSIAYQTQEALPGTIAQQVRQVAQNEGEVLRRVQLLMMLVTLAALFAAGLAVSSSTAAVVIERRGEIALMKALGSPEWLVAAFLLAETALQGLAGGVLGYGAGYLLAQAVGRQVFDVPASPPPVVLPLVLAVAVVVSWLGALWPLRAAMKFSPAAVLKEKQ